MRLLLTLATLALAPCPIRVAAQEAAPSQTQSASLPRVLRLAHQFPAGTADEGDFRDRLTRKFAAEVEKRTDGQLTVAVYPNGGLFKSEAQLDLLQRGALEMTLVPLVYAGQEIPEVNLTLMPALVTSYEEAANWKNAAIGRSLNDVLDRHGLRIVTWIWQAGGIVSRGDKPVLLPADLKGKKVRGAGREMDRLLKAAGGVIVNVPASDLSDSMRAKKLDVVLTSATTLLGSRLQECSKNVTTARDRSIWFLCEPLLISKTAFEALPPEQQTVVMEVGASLESFALEQAKVDDQALAEVFEKAGVKVVDMNAAQFEKWRALAKSTSWAEFEKSVQNGKELLQQATAVSAAK